MPIYYLIILTYLLLVNIIAAAVTYRDKQKARRHQWRTSESTLMALAFIGGSPGIWMTMLVIHHKTTRKKFMVGVPVLFLFQFCLGAIFYLFDQNHLLF